MMIRSQERLASLLLFAVAAVSAPQRWNFELSGVDGRTHTAEEWRDHAAVVLFFLGADCPISNRYAPEISRIVRDYSPKRVLFEIVYSDPDTTAKEADQHDREFGLKMTALMDPMQLLAARTGAAITPTAVALSPQGEVLYRGRIDDRYVDLATYRDAPQRQDLRLALDAILSHKAVAQPTTQAVGCFLPPPRRPEAVFKR